MIEAKKYLKSFKTRENKIALKIARVKALRDKPTSLSVPMDKEQVSHTKNVSIMADNLDVILRSTIPVELQGRVYACRNTLQFFTIPIGLFWGGWMVDAVCEPLMAAHQESAALSTLVGQGKGAGAAMVLFILGLTGCLFCLLAGRKLKKYHFSER